MKTTCQLTALVILCAMIGTVSTASVAHADFYVIPVKKSAASTFVNTVVVKPVGTGTENGTALLAAISGITDSSSTKPYLLLVEPGIYDVGAGTLAMKPYVDIQGSGENVTLIKGSVCSIPPSAEMGVVAGADNAELRFLSVENYGTSTYCAAIKNTAASPTLTFVTARSTGGFYRVGVSNDSSSAILRNVTVILDSGTSRQGWGIELGGSSNVVIENVSITITGSGTGVGVKNDGSTATLRNVSVNVAGTGGTVAFSNNTTSARAYVENSVLKGTNWLYNNGRIYVASSRIEGPVHYNNNIITCAGVFDENYVFFATTCPP